MNNSEKINALIPIFDWSWWQVFILTFTVCWLVGRIIKGLEPLGWEAPLKKGGRPIWWSGFYGDIFLPVGVTASIVTVKYMDSVDSWYTKMWWNWLGLFLGFFIIIFLETRGHYSKKQLLMPSKLWHTFVAFPFMFYLSFVSIIPLLITRKPSQAIVFAILGYGAWAFTYMHDVKHPPDYTKTH